MFSNDNNIESIAQLVEELKKYGNLKLEIFRLDATEKIVRIITSIILILVLSLLFCAIVTYLSFAGAYALAAIFDSIVTGFLCVSGFYLLLFLIVYNKRKAWIERPLVHFLASILLEK